MTQRGGYVELAAPAAYQGSQWQNGCFFGEVRAQARTVCLRPFKFSSGADPWVLNTEVFPDDAKDGYQHTFTVPAKQRVKSGRSRALRAANKAALAAMPEVARRELVQMVTGDSSASEKARESVAAELLVESPEAWKTVLGQEELGVAMIDAITRAGTGLERRIAVVDEASLREALLRAGRMYLEAMPTQAFRRRRMAYRITGQMLLAALELVVDGRPVTVEDDTLTLLDVLRGQPDPLFAILDAARDPLIYAGLLTCGEKHESLYESVPAQQMSLVSPFLVQFSPDKPFLESVLTAGWATDPPESSDTTTRAQ